MHSRDVIEELKKDGWYEVNQPCGRNDLLKHCGHRAPTPFGGDDHAGVKGQSHAGGFSGSRWLSMAASTSFAKSPSSVTVDPCASARAMDSERNRPGSGFEGRTATTTGSCPSMTISAPARARQHVRKVAGRFCFRDADHLFRHSRHYIVVRLFLERFPLGVPYRESRHKPLGGTILAYPARGHNALWLTTALATSCRRQ